MSGLRVLACGGRDYADWETVYRTLDAIEPSVSLLIEGGAKGADRLARDWAQSRLIPVSTYEADWKKHGNAAGPLRNLEMLRDSKPDLVVAFPGGKGTAHMVWISHNARVKVLDLRSNSTARVLKEEPRGTTEIVTN